MGIYAKILQDSITGIYRTNAANKILQFINRIRNESDVNQARRFLIELMQNARDLAYKKPDGDTRAGIHPHSSVGHRTGIFPQRKGIQREGHSFYHLSGILKEAG